MQNTQLAKDIYFESTSNQFEHAGKRTLHFVLLVIAGGVVTVSLFAMMAELIKQEHAPVVTVPAVTMDPIIYQSEEEKTIFRPTIKPIEKTIKTPPAKVEKLEPNTNSSGSNYAMNPVIPTTQLNIKVNVKASQGNMQATPQFRVDPSYPPQASRDGIEGWVKLGFKVSASGTVTDISVLDAKPSNVFNREARRALKKWKYKPKLIDGKPVEQRGMVVVLDFKLAQ